MLEEFDIFVQNVLPSFNFVDYTIISLVIISSCLSFANGIVKEILILFKWGVPIVAAYFYPIKQIALYVKKYFDNAHFQTFVGSFATFLIVYFICYIIFREINDRLIEKNDKFFSINKVIGFFYGIAKIYVFEVIFFAIFPSYMESDCCKESYILQNTINEIDNNKVVKQIKNNVKKQHEKIISKVKESKDSGYDKLYNELKKQ